MIPSKVMNNVIKIQNPDSKYILLIILSLSINTMILECGYDTFVSCMYYFFIINIF